MAIDLKEILLINEFRIDGKKSIQASNQISYLGFISQTFDEVIYGGVTDFVIPLTFSGVIKKIIITNESCGDLYYKLNNSEERYLVSTQAIISQQPTALKIDNDDADQAKVIRIKIIGEEN